jgi:hypothetical protein
MHNIHLNNPVDMGHIHLNNPVDMEHIHLNNRVDMGHILHKQVSIYLLYFYIYKYVYIGGAYGQNQMPFQPPPVVPRPDFPKG